MRARAGETCVALRQKRGRDVHVLLRNGRYAPVWKRTADRCRMPRRRVGVRLGSSDTRLTQARLFGGAFPSEPKGEGLIREEKPTDPKGKKQKTANFLFFAVFFNLSDFRRLIWRRISPSILRDKRRVAPEFFSHCRRFWLPLRAEPWHRCPSVRRAESSRFFRKPP